MHERRQRKIERPVLMRDPPASHLETTHPVELRDPDIRQDSPAQIIPPVRRLADAQSIRHIESAAGGEREFHRRGPQPQSQDTRDQSVKNESQHARDDAGKVPLANHGMLAIKNQLRSDAVDAGDALRK